MTDPTDTVNRNQLVEGFGVGNIFECAHNPDISAVNRLPAIDVTGQNLRIRDLYFSFDDNRTFFVQFNDTGARGASSDTTVAYFHTGIVAQSSTLRFIRVSDTLSPRS